MYLIIIGIKTGVRIIEDGNCEPEINDKINRGRVAISKLNSVLWNLDVTVKTKTHIYYAIVKSTITYASETWCLKAKTMAKLNSTETDCWRRSARISRKYKIRNTVIKQRMNVTRSLLDDIKTKQLQWYGHVQRMEGGRLPKEVINGVHQEEQNEEDLNSPGRKGLEDGWVKRDWWRKTGTTGTNGGRR
jgi:hypothetical protein